MTGKVPQDNELHTYSFPPVQARYVQLYVHNNWGSQSYTTIYHFQALTRDRQGGIGSLEEVPPAAIAGFSSQASTSYPPENAIDESSSSGWYFGSRQTSDQWIKVQLGGGRTYTIDRVRLQSGYAPAGVRDFEIRVSTTTADDAAFSTVFSGSAANDTTLQEFSFPPVQARYVQLFVMNNQGYSWYIQINSFQVLTPDGANAARLEGAGVGFIAEFSSQLNTSLAADNAIDYDTTTAWWTANDQTTDQWLKVLLIVGESRQVDRIRLRGTSGSYSPKDFQIRISNASLDDADFTTVLDDTLPSDGGFHWFTFPPVAAKYVQLYISNNYGAPNMALYDFRVFSPQLGGATVPFEDRSIGPVSPILSWSWDFGDGNTSTDQHPTHIYAAPGSYPVSLSVTDSGGITDTTTMTYTVLQPPTADFEWSPAVPTEQDTTTFSDTSSDAHGPIMGWQWQYHTSGSTSQNTSTTFPDNGDFQVILTVTDSQLLMNTVTKTLTVLNAPPSVNAGPDPSVPVYDSWTTYPSVYEPGIDDQASLLCHWDFGDGQTAQVSSCDSSSARISHAYTQTGVYAATLTVTDKDGASASDSLSVDVIERESIIVIYGPRSIGGNQAEIEAGLYDLQDWDRVIVGRTISFTWNSQTVTGTTDANGIATALAPLHPDQDIILTAAFAGDSTYNPTSETDLIRVLPMLPDLIVLAMDRSNAPSDAQDLTIDGDLAVQLKNQGNLDVNGPFQVTIFEDHDRDGVFANGVDNALGQSIYNQSLAAGQSAWFSIPVSGSLLSHDNVLYAFVDSSDVVAEADEANNYSSSGQACEYTPAVGSFSPQVEWAWIDTSYGSLMTPVVSPLVDTNGDGSVNEEDIPAIIFIAGGNRLVAVRGDGRGEIFDVADHPVGAGEGYSQIAVGDIDNDGLPEILTITVGGYHIIAFENDGTFKWLSDSVKVGLYGGPSLADLDQDGTPEIIVGAIVFNADGTFRWRGYPIRGINRNVCCLSVVADVDLDGVPEVIVGGTVYRADGELMWLGSDGWPAVANFDSDPFPEIAVVSRGNIRLYEHDGRLKWGPVAIPGPDDGLPRGDGGPLTIADVDGDGEPEIGVAGTSKYSILEADGSVKWSSDTQDWSSNITGSSVFDFEGDGSAEVVYNDEEYFRIYRGSDGQLLFEVENRSWTLLEYPVIADVDRDGNAEIVVIRNGYPSIEPGIYVYGDANDTWVSTRGIWNQHAYHVTNVNDDGSIPAQEANSWEVHNTYRANIGLDPWAAPDLTASRITINPTDFPISITLTARIGNVGANLVGPGLPVAFYSDDPAAGGILLGVGLTMNAIEPGGFEDVSFNWTSPRTGVQSIYIFADDDGTGAGTQNECNESNNSLSRQFNLLSDLIITKDSGQTTVLSGQTLTYTLNATNQGLLTAFSVAITDTLPTQAVTFTNASDGGSEWEGVVTWPLFDLAAGASATRTVTIQVTDQLPAGVEVITNTATVADDGSTGTDPTPEDNNASDTTQILVSNRPPALAAIGDQLLDENITLDVPVSAGDPDGDAITLSANGMPAFVSITDNGDGTGLVNIAPGFGDAGLYSNLEIRASDGALTDTKVFSITVLSANHPPSLAAIDDQLLNEGATLDVAISASDPDGDAIALSAAGLPPFASITGNGDGTGLVAFAPGFDDAGLYPNMEIRASDGAFTDTKVFSITVLNVNRSPIADDQMLSTDEDTPLDITLTAADLDGDGLSFTILTDPTQGTLSGVAPNLTYAPDPDVHGPDSFTFQANDGAADSNIAAVSITIIPVNDPPVAADDTSETQEDTAVTVDVLDNDDDIDGDTLGISSVGQPGNGNAVINPDNTITYTPDPDYYGQDTFEYTIGDGQGGTDTALITIDIIPVNDRPAVADDSATTNEDTPVTIDVLANDVDVDGDTLSVDSFTQPGSGMAIINPDNTVTYTPDPDYCGPDGFTYTVSDGNGGFDSGGVDLNVECVNDPPVAVDDSVETDEDTALAVDSPGFMGNDYDVDGDVLSFASHDTTGAIGLVTANPDGSFSYDPDDQFEYLGADESTTDSFTYTITDGNEEIDAATVEVTITGLNDAPVVTGDVYTITGQYSDAIPPAVVTAHDVDSAGLTFSTVDLPTGLTLGAPECTNNTSVSCTAEINGVIQLNAGSYPFKVEVSDGDLATSIDLTLVVEPEQAAVLFDDANPVAEQVAAPGGNSGKFDLTVQVRELVVDTPVGLAQAGNIALAQAAMQLTPVGPGSSAAPIVEPCPTTVEGTGYDARLIMTCTLDDVPVNAYTVQVTLDGGYYAGSGEDVLVVYDPSLGFTTGGGWFYWPGSEDPAAGYPGDKTNFGYTMKYNKKGQKVQGSLLLIRHVGQDAIYRVKSNVLYGLALGEAPDGSYGWATFSGKSNYLEPGWLDPEGNHEFIVYVEDRDEPGSGIDRFWIETRDKDGLPIEVMSMPREAQSNTVEIQGGNLVVPHRRVK